VKQIVQPVRLLAANAPNTQEAPAKTEKSNVAAFHLLAG
jgi:hypothetical protein